MLTPDEVTDAVFPPEHSDHERGERYMNRQKGWATFTMPPLDGHDDEDDPCFGMGYAAMVYAYALGVPC